MQQPRAGRRVLVARLDNDGDVLLAGPAIRAIAASGASVTLLCGPRGRAAAAVLPGVARVAEFRAPWIDPDAPRVELAAVADLVQLARGHHEAVILTSFHQDPLPLALLLRLADIPTIAANCEDYPGSLLDTRHHADDDLHEVERNLALVRSIGYELPDGDDGQLHVLQDGVPFDGCDGDAYVVVHPGASVPARAWSPVKAAMLVAGLARLGVRVVVTGGPGEAELTALVAGRRTGVLDLGGRTTFGELASVLAGASVVVAANTGPAHLAAAVGSPVVSLFAPTVPLHKWRPYAVPTETLFREVPCSGCRARVCPVAGHPCLDGVEADDALLAIGRLAPELVFH